MAYIDGIWLTRPERAKRIDLLTARLRKLAQLAKSGKATDYHIDSMRKDKAELEKCLRVHRAENDSAYFSFEYLSDERNPENEDNIIRNDDDGSPHAPLDDLAPIHREFCDLMDYVDHEKRDANLGIAAPRGHSKSGFFSNTLPLHQLCNRKRFYILVVSETDTLSKKLIGWVNKQLKYNAKLIEDYGPLMNTSKTQNEKDNEEGFITTTNALVEASSSGKAMRGKRHGALRPDLVVVDDPSSVNNEGTREAREKLIEWFNAVVLPIGSRSTAIVLVGTMVTATGLLSHVLKRKDFRSCFYDAILDEPDFPELWEQYNEIYSRSDEPEDSEQFYQEHKAQLEAGIRVAWEWRWTYRELMHRLVNMGRKSFNSEYRNRAYSEDEQFFFPEKFAYYTWGTSLSGDRFIAFDGKQIKLSELTISGSWDIAMGKNARSCFNAMLTVGKHEKTGYIFVLDEYASKEQPHKFMDEIVSRIRQFRHHIFSVETINAQHEFYRQLQERLRHEGLYTTRVQDVKGHSSSKEARIESLEPYCSNKTLVFNEGHRILLEQMAAYPHGDYVDSIDSLQISVEHVVRPRARVTRKPKWL